MNIAEAIRATDERQPCITRASWARWSRGFGRGIKIQPTNSPDGCIIESDVGGGKNRRSWQPTAEDLAADDWEPTRL